MSLCLFQPSATLLRQKARQKARRRARRRALGRPVATIVACALAIFTSSAVADDATGEADAKPASSRPSDEQDPKKVTEIEGISQYTLDNGVEVLLFPDPSKEVVTVNMTVFVGSRHEGYGEAGMAHLLEHMLFKGTPTHPNVPELLQDRGGRFNGTTWTDRTNYYETLPASDENLEFALKLEADRLINSYIKGEDLESEMTVVRNEFERTENSPLRILMQRIQATAYEWHNYGQSTIGNRSDIERVPVVKLRKFYRKFYRPDNSMVIVAGKFDPEKALEYIDTYFGALQVPDTPLDDTYTVEPPQDGERTVVLRRVGEVQYTGAAYHIPPGSHPDFAAIKALYYILGDEPSGRLYKQMVEKEIASNVFSLAYAFREPGLFMALAEVPDSNSIEQARAKLIEVVEESFHENPVTEQEVERAKQNILKQRELEASETDRLAVSLSEWAAQGDWRLYFLFRDRVEKLTTQQVQQAAEKYFVRNNRTVGLFIPSEEAERVKIPESPDLKSLLEGYEGREDVEQGEQFDPSPMAIQERTERGQLVGGLEYALVPKQTRGNSVSLMLTLRFGTGQTLKDKVGAVELLGSLMSRGTEKLNYEQLQDELTRLRAELSMNSTIGLLQMQVKTKRKFLPEVIALIGDILKHPRLSAEELEVIRRQVITGLEQSTTEPNALAPRAVRKKLSPYGPDDVRYVRSIEEEIELYKAVTVEEIRSLHEKFLGNQAGEVAVVGDFEAEAVKAQLTEQLEGWTSSQPYDRVGRPPHPEIAGEVIQIETPDKSNALMYSSQQYALSDEHEDYAPLVLGNYILGGGTLSSRLADRVRQREGLSYGVRSGLTARSKDDRTDFTLYAITNPENKDRLLEVIREEIHRLREEGVTEEELAKAQESYLQTQRVRRTENNYLASEWVGLMFNNRSMEFQAEHENQVEAATVAQVNEAIREYINADGLVIAFAGDFAAADSSASEPEADESEEAPKSEADSGAPSAATPSE